MSAPLANLHANAAPNHVAPQITCSTANDIVQRLGRAGAELTFVVAALVLGSLGTFMSPLSLWVCWGIPLLKLLMDFSISRSWQWLVDYLRSRTGDVEARRIPCLMCDGSLAGLDLTPADSTVGHSGPASIKVALAIVLLLETIITGLQLSAGCSNPPCSDRAKENVIGLSLLVIILEGIPLLLTLDKKLPQTEGLDRVKRSFHLLLHAICELWWNHSYTFLIILQSFHASASGTVLVMTGSLLVGGSFGNYMTRRVDLQAEMSSTHGKLREFRELELNKAEWESFALEKDLGTDREILYNNQLTLKKAVEEVAALRKTLEANKDAIKKKRKIQQIDNENAQQKIESFQQELEMCKSVVGRESLLAREKGQRVVNPGGPRQLKSVKAQKNCWIGERENVDNENLTLL
ncbi:hypothetical protein L7F22_058185 [Adiantum nelumboides]|nr:hypothetical protein [Adiantum nelumboides]